MEQARRIGNENLGIKNSIEAQKSVIQKLLEGTEKASRVNKKTKTNNEQAFTEVDQRIRHVTVLDDQNVELERELD